MANFIGMSGLIKRGYGVTIPRELIEGAERMKWTIGNGTYTTTPWEANDAAPLPFDIRGNPEQEIVWAVNEVLDPLRPYQFTRTDIGRIVQKLLIHAETLPDDAPPAGEVDCA